MDKEYLKNLVREINDSSYEDFKGFPESFEIAVIRWSNALYDYYKDLFPPSSNYEIARNELRVNLRPIRYSNNIFTTTEIFENSITIMAETLSKGIKIQNDIFEGFPPTKKINLLPIFLRGLNGGSAYNFAKEFSDEVHEFMLTGTAINKLNNLIINWY